MERKTFQDLPGKENPQFLEDGKEIYLKLKKKYPNESAEHLDNILNGLCAALTCLITTSVGKDNHADFLQLIHSILKKNI